MVSWWVQYLAKSLRPDFNNGPRDNLDSGRILAPAFVRVQFKKRPLPRPFQSCNAEEDYHSLHYRRPFDLTIFPAKML